MAGDGLGDMDISSGVPSCSVAFLLLPLLMLKFGLCLAALCWCGKSEGCGDNKTFMIASAP